MSKLAVFVHYSKTGFPCSNALKYLEELSFSFDKVIIASNITITTKEKNVVSMQFVKNGYDFGYFYQALISENVFGKYDTIGFFNDSNYIIKPLTHTLHWCLHREADIIGITDSLGGRPDLPIIDQSHIQSHFLIFKNKAVDFLKEYFRQIQIEKYLDGSYGREELRKRIIIECEIMLSLEAKKKGLKLDAYYKASETIPRLKGNISVQENMHIYLWKELIEDGYPFIKRKIYNKTFTANDLMFIMSQTNIHPIHMAKNIVQQYGNYEYTKSI